MKNYIVYVIFATMIFISGLNAETPVLNEMPRMNEIRKKQPVNIGEYNGSGVIDDVHEKEIILDDRSFNLSPSIEIYNLKGNSISKKLGKGQYIYYFLNQKNQISKIFVEE